MKNLEMYFSNFFFLIFFTYTESVDELWMKSNKVSFTLIPDRPTSKKRGQIGTIFVCLSIQSLIKICIGTELGNYFAS